MYELGLVDGSGIISEPTVTYSISYLRWKFCRGFQRIEPHSRKHLVNRNIWSKVQDWIDDSDGRDNNLLSLLRGSTWVYSRIIHFVSQESKWHSGSVLVGFDDSSLPMSTNFRISFILLNLLLSFSLFHHLSLPLQFGVVHLTNFDCILNNRFTLPPGLMI